MSQLLPDYEAMRASQARSQQADRIGPDPAAGRPCGCLPDEKCYWCAPCTDTLGCFRVDKHKSKCAVRG